jgi:hypothetical protein
MRLDRGFYQQREEQLEAKADAETDGVPSN